MHACGLHMRFDVSDGLLKIEKCVSIWQVALALTEQSVFVAGTLQRLSSADRIGYTPILFDNYAQLLKKSVEYEHLKNSRLPTKQQADHDGRLVVFGAEPAHNFELVSSIADWLFTNKIADAFRLPSLDTESLRLQRLQPSYTY